MRVRQGSDPGFMVFINGLIGDVEHFDFYDILFLRSVAVWVHECMGACVRGRMCACVCMCVCVSVGPCVLLWARVLPLYGSLGGCLWDLCPVLGGCPVSQH